MKKLLFAAVFLAACGGGGPSNGPVSPSSAPFTPPVVLAQSSFSNATLSGTYVFSGYMQNTFNFSEVGDVLGSLQFNGAGNITGGSYGDSEQPVPAGGPAQQCGPINILSGSTYSVDASGALTVSLILNAQNPTCNGLLPSGLSGHVQQNGQGFVFVGTGNATLLAGTGLKQ
jgi:hypothetical protein